MKYVIVSDIHGSAGAAEKIAGHFRQAHADFLIILGDILYHGPRNPLPGGHDPKQVAALLNTFSDQIVAVRGNCDAEVDQLLLDFPCMSDYALLSDGPRLFFLTHGHLYNDNTLPFSLKAGTVCLSGHTHIWQLEKSAGLYHCNPGSVSLPKSATPGDTPPPSYAIYDNGNLGVYSLETGAPLAQERLI
ncbi:MAG: phosphodiesterase [Spirochaetaceae bacterium]|jgi:putative phosphoesterase|nr:phosphodiesterase [Spirochaetaceae bacterium]